MLAVALLVDCKCKFYWSSIESTTQLEDLVCNKQFYG